MRLIQIPFSHNCVKVRFALELKRLPFETLDISPIDRKPVAAASGQGMVPVLQDGEKNIVDSTAILHYLEQSYPERPLVPRDPAQRAECWLLEDWADRGFMALSRRLAYWRALQTPGAIEKRFFPGAGGVRRWILTRAAQRAVRRRFRLSESGNRKDEQEARRLSALAVNRLGSAPWLVGDRLSVADLALATMSAPLHAAYPAVRDDPAVGRLLEWGLSVIGSKTANLYRPD